MRLDLRLHRRHPRFHHLALQALRLGHFLRLGGLRFGLDPPGVGNLDRRRNDDEEKREVRQVVADAHAATGFALDGVARLGINAGLVDDLAPDLVDDLAPDVVTERGAGCGAFLA